jgi:drug/metabolite transporter (DMT)-like permease
MAEPFAPHVHDGFSVGACIEGLEMIRYRDRRHYAAPGGDGQRPGWPWPTAEVVECEVAVSRRGWVLFAIMCVVWGIPYLLIKVAVGSVSVPMVVFARTALGALVLLPLALRSGQLGALRHAWRPLVAFAALEMIVPWGLLSNAERQLPSSLAGLLIASVPIIGVVIARLTGGTERLSLRRWAGLLVGLAGVAVLAAQHLAGGHGWPIAEVLLVAIGYATAPLIAARKLADVPALPMTTACLSLAALVYTPAAILTWPHHLPSGQVLAALAALGVICTACAFIVFLQLLREVGPSRAMVFTYINPAVAVAAGVLLLSEPFTVTIAAAFVLILTGCALATGGRGHDRSGDGSSGNRGQPDQDRNATAPSAAGNPDQAPAGQP